MRIDSSIHKASEVSGEDKVIKNTVPMNEKFVFEGLIPRQIDDLKNKVKNQVLKFDTGYTCHDISSSSSTSTSSSLSKAIENTHTSQAMLSWQCRDDVSIDLYDAYEHVNTLDQDPFTGATYGSSHNAVRIDTIDYIWYEKRKLQLKARSPLVTTMPDGTPDRANPSDHIPLIARFKCI